MEKKDLSLTNLYTDRDRRLVDAFKEDPQLARFCAEWIKNGGNSTKAYLKLHPTVTAGSARVLGSRELAKVNMRDFLAMMGITNSMYVQMLVQGLNATKNPYSESPDHTTRFKYFMVLGRLLGVDNSQQGPMAIFNNLNAQVNKEK